MNEIQEGAAQKLSQGCGRKLGPFDCCTVVCGDCLELMKQLPDGCVDAVITDPPYGIGLSTKYGGGIRRGAYDVPGKNYPPVFGDNHSFNVAPLLRFRHLFLWGANHYAACLPSGGTWHVWDKRCGVIPERCQGDGELAWCSAGGVTRIFRHMWDGMVKDSERGIERQHPTQKPIELMAWCIGLFPAAKVILDPFLGSGTTAVAAKKLGRHFLGFEISPEYCEIARKRIALVEAQPTLFEKKPEQLSL